MVGEMSSPSMMIALEDIISDDVAVRDLRRFAEEAEKEERTTKMHSHARTTRTRRERTHDGA